MILDLKELNLQNLYFLIFIILILIVLFYLINFHFNFSLLLIMFHKDE